MQSLLQRGEAPQELLLFGVALRGCCRGARRHAPRRDARGLVSRLQGHLLQDLVEDLVALLVDVRVVQRGVEGVVHCGARADQGARGNGGQRCGGGRGGGRGQERRDAKKRVGSVLISSATSIRADSSANLLMTPCSFCGCIALLADVMAWQGGKRAALSMWTARGVTAGALSRRLPCRCPGPWSPCPWRWRWWPSSSSPGAVEPCELQARQDNAAPRAADQASVPRSAPRRP